MPMKKPVPFRVTILGSSAAMPAHGRNHTSQLIEHDGAFYLMDCGEGAQLSLLRRKLKVNKLKAIFISHLHGDHMLGLPGLLTTLSMMSRTKPLDVYGPAGLDEFLTLCGRLSGGITRFEMRFHLVDTENSRQVYEDKHLTVNTLPLRHRVPCAGYCFTEKQQDGNILSEKLPKGIHYQHIQLLKKGYDVTVNGQILRASEYTQPAPKPRSYAYCSDTRYKPALAPLVEKVNLLYHEATFLHERLTRAEETFHTTALEAGLFAEQAKIQHLLIGHFSARYKDLSPLLAETQRVFPNASLAEEGRTFEVPTHESILLEEA